MNERTKEALRRKLEPATETGKVDITIEHYVVGDDPDPDATPEENGKLTRRLEGDSRDGLRETYRDDSDFLETLAEDDDLSDADLRAIAAALDDDTDGPSVRDAVDELDIDLDLDAEPESSSPIEANDAVIESNLDDDDAIDDDDDDDDLGPGAEGSP